MAEYMPLTVQVENVGKRYALGRREGVDALQDVTFRAGPGVTGIVGPNGAGKTTLFGLLLGFLKPTAGEVRVAGLAPRRYLREHGASYLPERFQLPGGWRVRPTLQALARLEGHAGAAAGAAAAAALERFDLAEHADKPLDALSHGLLQRVGIAQALLARRELVVLDEPAEGLDPLWRIRLRELVRELGAEGRTVLLASHDLSEMERLAARVIVLDEGRLREVLTVEHRARESLTYRIVAAGAVPLSAYFDRVVVPEAGTWLVTVADAGELSRRLEAFLVAGGELVLVQPEAAPSLEERVRRTLAGDDA
jgi:ABC-2 type transport system ATP-binding protein